MPLKALGALGAPTPTRIGKFRSRSFMPAKAIFIKYSALKVYKPGAVSEKAPQIQYDALLSCNRAVSNYPILLAPKALAFLPEDRAILMEWQDAPTLRAALWHRFAAPQRRRTLIAGAGSWLRAFHELSNITAEPLDASKLVAKLDTQLSRNPTATVAQNIDPTFHTALNRFHKLAATTTAETPHALLHGDFTPTNLLVKGNDVIGMDMWGMRRAPVYEDIARMLVYLGVVSPVGFSAEVLGPHCSLLQAFAQGYGTDKFDAASAPFQTVVLYQQLRRWLVYANRKTKHPYSPLARWQYVQNKRLTGQTLTWLKDC